MHWYCRTSQQESALVTECMRLHAPCHAGRQTPGRGRKSLLRRAWQPEGGPGRAKVKGDPIQDENVAHSTRCRNHVHLGDSPTCRFPLTHCCSQQEASTAGLSSPAYLSLSDAGGLCSLVTLTQHPQHSRFAHREPSTSCCSIHARARRSLAPVGGG